MFRRGGNYGNIRVNSQPALARSATECSLATGSHLLIRILVTHRLDAGLHARWPAENAAPPSRSNILDDLGASAPSSDRVSIRRRRVEEPVDSSDNHVDRATITSRMR